MEPLAQPAAARRHAFVAHARHEKQSDGRENDVDRPHRPERRDDAFVGQRLTADEPNVIDREHDEADAEHEAHPAARKAQRQRRANKHEDDARHGQ